MTSIAAGYRCLLLLLIPLLITISVLQFTSSSPPTTLTTNALSNKMSTQNQSDQSTAQILTSTTTTKLPTSTSKKCEPYNVSDTRPFFEREPPQLNLPRLLSNSSRKRLRRRLRTLQLVVVACAHNVAQHFEKFKNHVEPIVDLFQPSSRILIFESYSSDNTFATFKKWSRAEVYTPNDYSKAGEHRTERIAYCRNQLLEKARELQTDYILAIDIDIFAVNVSSFLTNFDYNIDDWSVMTANLIDNYYDIWALRTLSDSIMNFDVWHFVFGTERVTHYCQGSLIHNTISIHQKPFPKERGLLEVRSAFGGAGLYKMKATEGCEYSGQGHTCEHVPFHTCIRERNQGRIFINPKFTNKEGFKTI